MIFGHSDILFEYESIGEPNKLFHLDLLHHDRNYTPL